ncbi:MAG: tetratricopeptide repeat protein [Clostridia bacterium]|nr:tetratricopeptide repeat protein [Clostridia bacterium]
MWFEDVVIILTWFLLVIVNIRLMLERKKVIYLISNVVNFIFAIIYFINKVIHMDVNWVLQICFLLFMFITPTIFIWTKEKDLGIKQKIIILLGKIYYDMGRYDLAIKLYSYIIKKNKKGMTSNNYYILGRCLRKEKRYLDARDMLIEAIELEKDNYKAYYELGLTLNSSDKKETAIIMFTNALKINPYFKDASIALAITYSEIDRYKEAKAIYKEIIDKGEADEEVYYNLANLYYIDVETQSEAEKYYYKAVEINNKLYAAWFSIGIINYLKGDYNASINALEIAKRGQNFKNKAEYNLAKCYVAINKYEKAEKILKKVLENEPLYIDKIKEEIIFEKIAEKILN